MADAALVASRHGRESSVALPYAVMAKILSENASVKALDELPSKHHWLWRYKGKVGRAPAWEECVPIRLLLHDILTETNGEKSKLSLPNCWRKAHFIECRRKHPKDPGLCNKAAERNDQVKELQEIKEAAKKFVL